MPPLCPPRPLADLGRVVNRHGIDIDERTRAIQTEEKDRLRKDADDERTILKRATYSRLREMLLGQTATAAPKGVKKGSDITEEVLDSVEKHEWWKFAVKDDKVQADLEAVKSQYDDAEAMIRGKLEDRIETMERGAERPTGGIKRSKAFVAVKVKR